MNVCIWPRKKWIKPAVRDLAYALARAAETHPRRSAFGAHELHIDFAGPLPATAARMLKHRSVELQRCVRGLGLELRDATAGVFAIVRTPATAEERIAA